LAFSLIVLSTEYWDSIRQARKELLYRALLTNRQVDYLAYIEPMCHWWQGQSNVKHYRNGAAHIYRWMYPLPGERFYPVLLLNRFLQSLRISQIFSKNKGNITGIIYHPYNWLAAKHVRGVSSWLFDWTDDWGIYHNSDTVAKLQDRSIKRCDGVIAASTVLYERALSIRRDDRVLFLPNATALKPPDNLEEPEELVEIDHPRIGFIGHVGSWIDLDLVKEVAKRIPEYQWCILGYASYSARKQFISLANIHFLGIQPYYSLPNWMAFMDVLVAPYNQSAQEFVSGSSKIYDYFFSGKPIVSSRMSTAYHFPGLIEIAHQDPEAWEIALEKCLKENDPDLVRRRKKAAAENTWEERASVFIKWLQEIVDR